MAFSINQITDIKISDLLDDSRFKVVKEYILHGDSGSLTFKLKLWQMHLHDLFQEEVKNQFGYTHSGDLDPTLISRIQTVYTPDLYSRTTDEWADVTITRHSEFAAHEKAKKYFRIFAKDKPLSIFCLDVNTMRFLVYRFYLNSNDQMSSETEVLELRSSAKQAITKGLEFFKSAKQFDSVYDEDRKPLPELPPMELCDEAADFFQKDNGLLRLLLNSNSYDSEFSLAEKFRKYREKRLDVIAHSIASEAYPKKTDFKATELSSIKLAFEETEKMMQGTYTVLQKPKPSCHGLPGALMIVPDGEGDKRHFVVNRFYAEMLTKKSALCQEMVIAIERNVNIDRPAKNQYLKDNKARFEKMTWEGVQDKPKDLQFFSDYQRRMKEVIWDRNCLKLPKNGLAEKLMGIGKTSTANLDVPTVPFWEESYPSALKSEIRRNSCIILKDEACWSPHQERMPNVKECGVIYSLFIKSKLYQQICAVAKLASNISRMVTKARTTSSITTAYNACMAAVVGPGNGAMSENVTVPILWLALGNPDESSFLWQEPYYKDGDLQISCGDRLTKARLQQMIDAPYIAAVTAATVSCTLKGGKEDLLYACGVLAATAMSINIRDSELIDHIRYMVPNIFSERSCAVGYIRDKYCNPLKTRLQALIYQETRSTLLQSAAIAKEYTEVVIENEEVIQGGVSMKIPFLCCTSESVFNLNGIVYSGFFSCKKGLHDPKVENRKMFDKICEFEYKNFKRPLFEASTDPLSYHYFDAEYVAFTMSNMVERYGNHSLWRSKMSHMDNLKKPYELRTFSSLRGSLKPPFVMEKFQDRGMFKKKSQEERDEIRKRSKRDIKVDMVTSAWDELWSDMRTRVIDQYFDLDMTILDSGVATLKDKPDSCFYATWDQKRQRTGRDREVFILDPDGKVFMHNVESLFKIVCEGVPHEMITLPGNKKIIAMGLKGTQYFKKQQQLKAEGVAFENMRMTEDMTKWAPGDNICKFIYAIAGLGFLTKQEKIWYINFLCTSLRKKIVLNGITTEVIGTLAKKNRIKTEEMWAHMMGVSESNGNSCNKFSKNFLNVRFNWLMGVLNDTSSAVHAACALMLERILSIDFKIHHYEPDVHSDDAAVDLIVTKKETSNVTRSILDYFPAVTICNLNRACIKLSEKKSYIDKYRKEFVSEVDDNGIMKSYWHKQGVAAISGMSYIDFFRDLSEGGSKVSNLISLGGPPTVYEVTMSCVIDLSRDTYSMLPGMWNDPCKVIKDVKRDQLPLELGGSFTMNPALLPIVGLRFQTFSKMMDFLLASANVNSIDEITEEILESLKTMFGDIFCSTWIATTEAAVKHNLVLDKLDPPLIRFKQFSSYDKVMSLRLMDSLEDFDQDYVDTQIDADPTRVFRQPESLEEQQLKIAMLIKNPAWYSSATLQSQGALKMDRMFNTKTACCTPRLTPKSGDVMETPLHTIREAIAVSYEELKKKKVTLYDVYWMLKSMPLMCYVYEIEKKVQFRPAGPKQLFPVQKEAFIKDRMVESSVVGLLQYAYTGQTNYNLDRYNLDKEMEIVKHYQEGLSHMERAEQATTIYRIFQQTRHFSSVYYVPSPRLKGYEAIMGVLANQYSDIRNWLPKKTFLPPENKIYETLKKKTELSFDSKCSEVASFLMRICENSDAALAAYKTIKINGQSLYDHVLQSPNNRQLTYAKVFCNQHKEIYYPGTDEIIWILAQQRSYPHWTGPFIAYINIGSQHKPIGMIVEGLDDMIESIYLLEDSSEYSNIKSSLIKFASKMRWRGSVDKHIRLKSPPNSDQLMLYFNQYGSSFQSHFRTNLEQEGLVIHTLKPGLGHPYLTYDEISPVGVEMQVIFCGQKYETRVFNQRLTDHFPIETNARIGIFKLKNLWNSAWFSVSQRYTMTVDLLKDYWDKPMTFLPSRFVKRLNEIEIPCETLKQDQFTFEAVTRGMQFTKNPLLMNIFSPGIRWNQRDFNLYLSYALTVQSTLTSWISFKGELCGFNDRFSFIDGTKIINLMSNLTSENHFDTLKMNQLREIRDSGQVSIEIMPEEAIQEKLQNWKNTLKTKPIAMPASWADMTDSESDEELIPAQRIFTNPNLKNILFTEEDEKEREEKYIYNEEAQKVDEFDRHVNEVTTDDIEKILRSHFTYASTDPREGDLTLIRNEDNDDDDDDSLGLLEEYDSDLDFD